MAERRMFARAIVGSARFLRMPASSRLLYYDLGVAADDDGVVEAFTVMRSTGASEDDLRVLVSKNFVQVLNDDLVVVILDWRTNNQIRKDRYHPSIYRDSLISLGFLEQKTSIGQPNGNQNSSFDNQVVDQRLTQSSLVKSSLVKKVASPRASRFTPPSVDEVRAYCLERKNGIDPERFVDFYAANGWKQGRGKPIVDWKAAVRTWERKEDTKQTHAPAEDWTIAHPEWADQSTWVPGPDGVYRPVGVKP